MFNANMDPCHHKAEIVAIQTSIDHDVKQHANVVTFNGRLADDVETVGALAERVAVLEATAADLDERITALEAV
jgi:hypothetical protein